MKYFTKDFYEMQFLTNAYGYVRKSDNAEQMDEEFYKKCYNKRLAIFLRNERMNDLFIDPAEELRKVDEFANEKNISDDEREYRVKLRETYVLVNKKRIESGKFYKLDREISKRTFDVRQKWLIEIFRKLPKDILDKIADIRVFALGYASAEVKEMLRPFCAKNKKTSDEIMKKAFDETSDTEKLLSEAVGFNDMREINIYGIDQVGMDIVLKTENGSFIFRNGKITEGQCKPVFPHNTEKPYCPWSRIFAAELHFSQNKFTTNFLIINLSETEEKDLWYLTICSTNIVNA